MFRKDAHLKLMHVNEATLQQTAEKFNWRLIDMDKTEYISCAMGKAKQKKIAKTTESNAMKAGERLFIDISLVNIESYGGSRYWAMIVNDYSNFKWCIFLKKKSMLKHKILPIIKELNLQNHTVKRIRCNNAVENYKLKEVCIDANLNIKFEFTAPNSPQYNGKVGRAFTTAYNKIRATLNHAGLTSDTKKKIWSECASTVIKIENILIKERNVKCPYEILFGHIANYAEDLRTFGEIVIVHDNGNKMKGKLSDQGLMAMFVGYSEHHTKYVYRFLNLKSNKIMMSRDATWMHQTYKDHVKEEINDVKEIVIDNEEYEEKTNRREINIEKQPRKQNIPRATRELQTSYNDPEKAYMNILNDEGNTFMGFASTGENVTYPEEPTTFKDAWSHEGPKEREGWQIAIKKEFNDMLKRGVWRRI